MSPFFTENNTEIQVGKYCVNRETALIAANCTKLPLHANNRLSIPVTIQATTGVPQLVRFARTLGNIPSSAKEVAMRGPKKDYAILMPPIDNNVPANTKYIPQGPII